jgi:hypothetical protein
MSARRRFVPFDQRFGPWADHAGRECDPTFSLDREIDSLRLGDPEKWTRLNRDWLDPVGRDVRIVEGEGK